MITAVLLCSIYVKWFINAYQTDGSLLLSTLSSPVAVYRDEQMIPYIEANNMDDALQAQGFIVAQERTYQLQLYRLLALGRLAEAFGERALKNDILIRMININGLAARQVQALDSAAKRYYENYVKGVNTYLRNFRHEHPFEVSAVGFEPELWTLQDIVAIQIFQSWANGSAWKTDLLNLQLIDEVGVQRAQQIAQVAINPEDNSRTEADLQSYDTTTRFNTQRTNLGALARNALILTQHQTDALAAGSNAWATGSLLSKNGKPILSNNPHLPAITLPGFWLPMGLFTPELTVAGVTAPGSPGIGVGRTQHIAYGATVGGSDGADIYIEQLDPKKPDHFLEGQLSIPLAIRNEKISIKDKQAEGGARVYELRIRSTPRGPLISDHNIAYNGDRALSLRWAASAAINNTPSTSLGSDRLLYAHNIDQAEHAMRLFPGALSHIAADIHGGIARISSGRVPKRRAGDGSHPLFVDQLEIDDWDGLISTNEMPRQVNPTKDWVGTANQRIIRQDYPYEYSKNFASSWRYRRIEEYFTALQAQKVDAQNHWTLINDIKNPMAERLTPTLINALQNEHPELAKQLIAWDYTDSINAAAPAIFQVIFKHIAILTFADEISPTLWAQLFDTQYFWQERLVEMLEQKDHPWFDNRTTPNLETRDDIINLAVNAAVTELTAKLGKSIQEWRWGDLHTITFHSPIIPGQIAATLFGAGTHPMYGSGETLNRSAMKLSTGYATAVNDSVRLVADLSDSEKVLAVIPGGVSGRYFSNSLNNQVGDWLAGRANPIWFDLKKVKQHAKTKLTLTP